MCVVFNLVLGVRGVRRFYGSLSALHACKSEWVACFSALLHLRSLGWSVGPLGHLFINSYTIMPVFICTNRYIAMALPAVQRCTQDSACRRFCPCLQASRRLQFENKVRKRDYFLRKLLPQLVLFYSGKKSK